MSRQRIVLMGLGMLVLSLAACGEGQFIPDGPLAERPIAAAEIVPATAIVARADVPTVDPSRLEDVDIAKAFGGPATCEFRYTPDGAPVVAFGGSAGGTALIKVNGDLVLLDPETAPNSVTAASGPVRLAMTPGATDGWGVPNDLRNATVRFAIGDELDVGYSGYTDCSV